MSTVEFFKDPNLWFSIISATLAVIALFQTKSQIQISNRQQLFDRRLDKYILLKDLLALYSKNRNLISKKSDICEMVDFQFSCLTNNSTLESMNQAMSTPLEQDVQNVFLTKCEQLEKAAIEIELIWVNDSAKIMSQFIRQYKDLLMAMYKQQISLNHLEKDNKKSPMLLEVFQKRAKESAEEIGLFSAINDIDSTFEEILNTNAERRLINSIRLDGGRYDKT